MRLSWNGTDITGNCTITGCIHRDAAGGRSDSLELTLDRASVWYRWAPEEGDRIRITSGEYTTGVMYLTAVIPQRDKYRILASSVSPTANRKTWEGFKDVYFRTILDRCAAECGMTGKIFGMEENLLIPYALRKGEGCAAFLNRIATAEGFRIKAYNGVFRAIYLPWAEEQEATVRMRIEASQEGVQYRRRDNQKYTGLTVLSPWAKATAKDDGAGGNNVGVVTDYPATDKMTAGRWARNLLRDHNRLAEEITLDTKLNTALGALARVHISGGTDMDGEWIVEEAEHDLKEKNTTAKLLRVIKTIR